MKKRYLQLIVGCMAGMVIASGYGVDASASELGSDMPTAGIAVALEQYYGETEAETADVLALLTPIVGSADSNKEESKDNNSETVEKTKKSSKKKDKNSKKEEITETETETQTEVPTEAETEPETTVYDTIAISRVEDYVNVRSTPSTEGDIVGKIYNNCAATIVENTGDWYKIESGNVQGYISSQYFVTGEAAKEVALEVGRVFATVTTQTLNVREGQGTETRIFTQLPEGEKYDVEEYGDGWVLLNVDGDIKGWVSQEFVDITVEFDKAVTLEEEQAMLAEQQRLAEEAAAAEKAAREAAEAEARRKAQAQAEAQAPAVQYEDNSEDSYDSYESYEEPEEQYYAEESNGSADATRSAVVAYAMQFVGNPYVYGGSSLTNGTDCSGFTMSVYEHFGYGLPHSSSSQSGYGVPVSNDSLQPGDLLFYTTDGSSGIGHVAMYIGGGQVVHASTPNTGIKVSSAFYRTPVAARRLIN